MSDPRFIFETVDFQNGANTINTFVTVYNAQCNAAVTGNTFKFRSDYDRMKNVLGSSGQSRTSGYFEGLYVNLYTITVTSPTLPSILGPGTSGWGPLLTSEPFVGPLSINDDYLAKTVNRTDYVGAQFSGYIYSPAATTVTFYGTTDDGAVIYVDGVQTTGSGVWAYQGPAAFTSTPATLRPGYTPVRILYFEGAGGSVFSLSYSLGSGPIQQFPTNVVYNYNQM